ncbi:MAG: acyl-CoA thioesterase [Bacteroidales bacterium]|nr:acyl-CoA thioesterase [Bacteroidales bacterium]
MEQQPVLFAEKIVDIRFSEVDSMGIVWHGSYTLYFEDAREEFGRKYGLEYLFIYSQGYYAPLVELKFNYKRPLQYQKKARVVIKYRPTEAAKLVFDYEIYDVESGQLAVTGHSVQVFMDLEKQLVLTCPDFFIEWKKKNGVP